MAKADNVTTVLMNFSSTLEMLGDPQCNKLWIASFSINDDDNGPCGAIVKIIRAKNRKDVEKVGTVFAKEKDDPFFSYKYENCEELGTIK